MIPIVMRKAVYYLKDAKHCDSQGTGTLKKHTEK